MPTAKTFNRWGIITYYSNQPNIKTIDSMTYGTRKEARTAIKRIRHANQTIWDAFPIKLDSKQIMVPVKLNVQLV